MMNADERPEDAFNIMRQSGAFDINARLRTVPPQGSTREEAHEERKEEAREARRDSQAAPQGGTPVTAPSPNAPSPALRSDTPQAPQAPARNN